MPATGLKVRTVDMAALTESRVIAAANLSNQATAWFSSTKRFLAKGAASWLYVGSGMGMVLGAGSG